MRKLGLLLIAALVISACSSRNDKITEQDITDSFEYKVNDEGITEFVFILNVFEKPWEKPEPKFDQRGRRIQERYRPDEDYIDVDQVAIRRLDKILDEKELCPNKINIHSQQQTPKGFVLKGECS